MDSYISYYTITLIECWHQLMTGFDPKSMIQPEAMREQVKVCKSFVYCLIESNQPLIGTHGYESCYAHPGNG